jgi:type I restriction enzyme S subunit
MAKTNSNPEVRFAGFTEDWGERRLDEVARFNPKHELPDVFNYVDLESVVGTEMISYRKEHKITAPSRAQRVAEKGDVFYQTVRPYQKNNLLFDSEDKDFVFSTGYAQLRPVIESDFLFTLIQKDEFVRVVLNNCTGTSYPAINSTVLASIKQHIPKSIEEQKLIGNFFENINKLITEHQQKHKKMKALKKAMLTKMLPKEGHTVPEIRFKGFSKDWEEKKLEEIGKATSGNSIESEFVKNGKYKVISIGSYSELSTYTDQGLRVNLSEKIQQKILNKDDLTMVLNDKTSAGNILGRVLLIDEDNKFVYNQRTQRVEPDKNNYCSNFLYQFLNAPNIRSRILKISQGNTQIYVNWSTVRELKYFFPSLEEQIKIADYFKNIDNFISNHGTQIIKLRNIKKAFLAKMFI